MHTLIARRLAVAAALAAATTSGAAWADGRRASVGVHVAGPGVAVEYRSSPRAYPAPRHYRAPSYHYRAPRLRYVPPAVWVAPFPYWGPTIHYGPSWYGGYYYGPAYPRVDPEPSGPQVWIERAPEQGPQADGGAGAQSAPQGWWYWCDEPQGYHPDVQECPGGWVPVAPQPAQQR